MPRDSYGDEAMTRACVVVAHRCRLPPGVRLRYWRRAGASRRAVPDPHSYSRRHRRRAPVVARTASARDLPIRPRPLRETIGRVAGGGLHLRCGHPRLQVVVAPLHMECSRQSLVAAIRGCGSALWCATRVPRVLHATIASDRFSGAAASEPQRDRAGARPPSGSFGLFPKAEDPCL